MLLILVAVALLAGAFVAAAVSADRRRQRAAAAWARLPDDGPAAGPDPPPATSGVAVADDRRPLVGYKAAELLLQADTGAVQFFGLTVGGAYPTDSQADCVRPGCNAPAEGCSCGFYAFRDPVDAVALLAGPLGGAGVRPLALLTVDLHGRVLEYERGFRAQRQTVTALRLADGCDRCRGLGQPLASPLAVAAAPSYVARIFFGVGPALRGYPSGWLPARPVCADHLPTEPGSVVATLDEVADRAGVAALWLPAGR